MYLCLTILLIIYFFLRIIANLKLIMEAHEELSLFLNQ